LSRHIRWGLILIMAVFIGIAASARYWLDVVVPINPEDIEEVASGFTCPTGLEAPICEALAVLYEENPIEADAMIGALLADPVPAPADEASEDSIAGDLDATTVSVFTTTLVRIGRFVELDALRNAVGTANIWEIVADDEIQRVLRLDPDFQVSQGPDLRVYLSIASQPDSAEEMLGNGSAVEVGVLKGNIGAQNYELPDELDITQYATVVIFSEEFQRIFSYAPLQQPVQ
jgi:hypothetical protein